VTSSESTIDTEAGDNLLRIVPHARIPAYEDIPESVQVYIWFSNCHYVIASPLLFQTPNIHSVTMVVTSGDLDALHSTTFVIDGRWKYRDFISSLIDYLETIQGWGSIMLLITHRECITFDGFALFLLPPNIPEDAQFINLLLLLSNLTKGVACWGRRC
jgi:hypothetical protein